MTEDRVECRTPAAGKTGSTRIVKWKYDAVRTAILDAVKDASDDGLAFKDLKEAVRTRMDEKDLENLGKLGWYTTTVKLNMEVEGELARLPKVSPQRIILA